MARNCGAEGIILDTRHHSRVIDCEGWQCREGVVLYGNDDWKSRTPDDVSASRFKTDSQVTVWQVNDFKLSEIDMDCTNTIGSYGLMIRDGTGTVENSVLVSSKDRADSTGGATYIIEGSDVKIIDSRLEGYFGVHAIGRAKVEVTNCRIDAPGGCFCTTDPASCSKHHNREKLYLLRAQDRDAKRCHHHSRIGTIYSFFRQLTARYI